MYIHENISFICDFLFKLYRYWYKTIYRYIFTLFCRIFDIVDNFVILYIHNFYIILDHFVTNLFGIFSTEKQLRSSSVNNRFRFNCHWAAS